MKVKILISALIIMGLFAGCSKDKFQSKPQLKIKSISGNVVPRNSSLQIILEFSDAEGDIQDTLFISKNVLNRNQSGFVQRSRYRIPEFSSPTNLKGDIELNLTYTQGIGNPLTSQNDTVTFSMALKDKAKNISDTVTTERIVILRN